MDYACGPRVNRTIADMFYSPGRRDKNGRLTAMGKRFERALREGGEKGQFADLFSAGEPKAHREIARRYSVDFRCVAGSCGKLTRDPSGCDIHGPFGAVFVVAGIGGEAKGSSDRFESSDGVENNSPTELAAWREQNLGCRFVMANKPNYAPETEEGAGFE